MCLALLALDAHPRYAAVVAANRDEYHARPTAAAVWWEEGWLAGRDLRAGGTWLGVTRQGRFALVTNFRDPARNDPAAPSRGALVPAVLSDRDAVEATLERLREAGGRHNGFNLLAGTRTGALWMSNRETGVRVLGPGSYGLSNALLDTPWPKVERSKAALRQWLASGDADIEPLFTALADRGIAADAELPSTGVTLAWERRLSAPFILGETYGTRSSTVLTIAREGEVQLVERSFDPSGARTGEVDYTFNLSD